MNRPMFRRGPRLIVLAAFVVALAVVPAALAGKGGKPAGGATSGSSLSLVPLNGATEPHYGGQVTFKLDTTVTSPIVSLDCTQGGGLVYSASRPMYWPNLWDDPGIFTLASYAWSGGAADCKASLITQGRKGRPVTLATLSFHVYA